ncbi:hypothetical protein N7497_003755 [Penicillium chrysogenum]|uniref:Azaphilone pigments biosynthesis cluster protein L N-terminal domain-containing protein n=1 Tax=Penicillium chrysogenum TaxID=5076 RepID=A0ABQ8WWP2_PENCH|nr:hypothetical protein N7505_001448 [Penicillium chrysogenum]KAJ6163776.1 hypothetical protein N7497_003755 [Penicillium chrysogenum]
MADPLSVTASVLAVITAAVQSTRSLCETIKRFKDRNKTLRRLQDELEDLGKILDSLIHVINAEASILALLQGPIDRCSQVCREFEQSMQVFNKKSNTGFRDWTKMEFMRGDINEFIDVIAGYKSTISIGLGTITMHTSKVSLQVLQEYNEMIQDTVYNLEVHLQRIDEKMARFAPDNSKTSDLTVDLKDEKEMTKQCIRICEDARSYIESLTHQESSLLQEAPQNADEDVIQKSFEAQLLTRQALVRNQESFADITGHLRKRLESLVLNRDPTDDRLRLQDDINISKQCLEICNLASNASCQKIYRIGEVVADGDSDQVVVTTLADLFDIKKAISRDSSAQLVGSMTEEALRHLVEKRYSSRFGALAHDFDTAEAGSTSSPQTRKSSKAFSARAGHHEQSPEPKSRHNRPSSNEMRKRVMRDATE